MLVMVQSTTHIVIPDVCLEHLVLLIHVQYLYETEAEVDQYDVSRVEHWTPGASLSVVALEEISD